MLKFVHRVVLVVLTLATVALAGSLIHQLTADTGDGAAADSGPCCFTNPRYTGVCQVVPSGDETCASILAYLNNPNATGKAYCGGTTVRGGWQQVSCEEPAAADLR